jgi:non-ribosomal peptide synthetase component F
MSALAERLAGLSQERRVLLELLVLEEVIGPGDQKDVSAMPAAKEAPLSFGQERLWVLDRLDPGNAAFNTASVLRLTGDLDVPVLARTVTEIARRHAVLRTTFREGEGGRPVQVIGPPRPAELPVVDLSSLQNTDQVLREALEAEVSQPFDLVHGPLYRVRLFRLGAREHVLVATLHHIVSDAWSVAVLGRELTAIHAAFAAGLPSPLPELPLQYADYARDQRARLQGAVLDEQIAWWRERLAGAPEVVEIPPDRSRLAARRFRGRALTRRLPRELSERVARLCRERSVTPFMTLLAAFEVLLHARSGQIDLVVGIDIANRNPPETEALLGFFVNQLVFRVDAGGDPVWLDLLERVRETAAGAFAHQDVPFERLVEELRPQRSLARNPLFQVMFGLYNVPQAAAELGGLEVAPYELEGGAAVFDVSLYLSETPDGLSAMLRYDADLYEPATAERLLDDFETVVRRVLDAPEERLSALVEHLAAERRRRLEAGRDDLQKARLRTLKTARRRTIDES